MPVRLLTIAGSDSSGGAGIAADLRTFAALGVHGAAALTAVTAQDSWRLLAIEPVSADLVDSQIRAVASDFGADAVKVGLLPTAEVVAAVARSLRATGLGPVVVDPVMRSSGGGRLTAPDVGQTLLRRLAAAATVLTPNLAELESLTGLSSRTPEDVDLAAARLIEQTQTAVIVTGGHGADPARVTDLVYRGASRTAIVGPRVAVAHSRGTGCVYSSALAVGLARGLDLADAARLAQETVRRGLQAGWELGGRRVAAPPWIDD